MKHSEQPHEKRALERERAVYAPSSLTGTYESTNNSDGAGEKHYVDTSLQSVLSLRAAENVLFKRLLEKVGAILDFCMPVGNSPLFKHSMSDTATDVVQRGAHSRIQFSLCFTQIVILLCLSNFLPSGGGRRTRFLLEADNIFHSSSALLPGGAVLARRSLM